MHWISWLLLGAAGALAGTALTWRIVCTPLPRSPKRVAAPKCPVYRLDEYQRRVDRRGRAGAQYAVHRLKR